VVEAVSPELAKLVPEEVPTRLLEDGVKLLVVLRNTLYELMEQLTGGVTAFQLRLMLPEDVAAADKPLGAPGTLVQLPPTDWVVALAWEDGPEDPAPSTASTT
jgi:hypothetical protein